MKTRTKRFTIDCLKLCNNLPETKIYNNIFYQLARSSSSVGANWRASQRPKSIKDFINKLKIVEEEADESCFWLEILAEISNSELDEINRLLKEANELTAITVASIKTAKSKVN